MLKAQYRYAQKWSGTGLIHRDIHGILFLHYLYAQIFDLFRPQWILLMFLREVWSTRLRKKVMSVWNYTKWDAQSGRETRHFLCFTIIRVFSVNFNQLFHERYEHFSWDKIKSTMLRDHSRSSLLGIRTDWAPFWWIVVPETAGRQTRSFLDPNWTTFDEF